MTQHTIDIQKIEASLETGTPLIFRFPYAYLDDKIFLNAALDFIVQKLKKKFLANNLRYVLQEVIDNANRALLKRVYFNKAGLDITKPDSYARGMETFALDYLAKEDEYVREFGTCGLCMEVHFHVTEGFLTILVKNTGLPTVEEMKRIQKRIDICATIRHTAEAFSQLSDRTEGAGLGTALSILLLRQITNNPPEIKPYTFYIDFDTEETIARVNISLSTLPEKLTEELSEKIVDEISSIPLYPENLSKLERMITQEDLPLSKIAAVIERDPALTAELLKVINSAQYYLPQKVKTIMNAVSLIGIQGIKNLILTLGAQKILERRYGKQEQLWEHAYRCAFYAMTIAKNHDRKELADDVYIGGILHDIGEIIIRSVDAHLVTQITEYCEEKGIAGNVVERLTLGCSHAKIGGHILRKWNFPDMIVAAVEYSGQPLIAPDEWKEIVEIVYTADQLVMVHEERIQVSSIEPSVFKKFSLDSVEAIQEYGVELDKLYQVQQEKNVE